MLTLVLSIARPVPAIGGATITLEIDFVDTIGDVKIKIQEKEGFTGGMASASAAMLRLVADGRQLPDDGTVAECHLLQHCTIRVLGRLQGGVSKPVIASSDEEKKPQPEDETTSTSE